MNAVTQFLHLGRISEIHGQLYLFIGVFEELFSDEIDARTATKIYLAYSRRVLTFITDI
jgi:hypothetical protein